MPHKYLIKEFEDYARSVTSVEPLMQRMSERIHKHIPRYNWVGFYLADKKDPGALLLGPHTGSFTPNSRISVDQGLCGLAACSGRIVVADDVAKEPHCLQTYDLVKSQISVPIVMGGKVLIVFHLESYFLATFKPTVEREFVENCARIVGRCLQKTTANELVNA
ncbi:MAG TPA: GAF domain-containing protein [Candidatus Angelobacter sp.]